MKIPVDFVWTKNFVAPIRFSAASDDGLSDDLCDPTSTIGFLKPDNAND